MVTNDMSVVPKMSEVCEFLLRNKVSPAFMTETWLQSSIAVSIIDIPGYSVLRRDRSSDHHGGVCLYINAEIRYKRLDALSCCPDHEVLWVQLRPKRLPRGFSSLIVAVVCHAHWSAAEDEFMQEHLFQSLQLVALPWLRSYCGRRLQSFWHEANRKAFPPQANSENSNQKGRNVTPCPH